MYLGIHLVEGTWDPSPNSQLGSLPFPQQFAQPNKNFTANTQQQQAHINKVKQHSANFPFKGSRSSSRSNLIYITTCTSRIYMHFKHLFCKRFVKEHAPRCL